MTPCLDEAALLARADACAGRMLGSLAATIGWSVPANLRSHKGWVGHLIERCLGVEAQSHAGPDIPHLGIEIKTIPVDHHGRPKESTWVCIAPTEGFNPGPWRSSPVREKLARVLWMPILDGPTLDTRKVGAPVLWSPSADEEETLANDWTSLTELLADGEESMWRGHHGTALQLRPKAARADDRIWVVDSEGEWIQTNPRGFYLRTSFTAAILAQESRLLDP